jgi:hypothetical protein
VGYWPAPACVVWRTGPAAAEVTRIILQGRQTSLSVSQLKRFVSANIDGKYITKNVPLVSASRSRATRGPVPNDATAPAFSESGVPASTDVSVVDRIIGEGKFTQVGVRVICRSVSREVALHGVLVRFMRTIERDGPEVNVQAGVVVVTRFAGHLGTWKTECGLGLSTGESG